MSPNGKRIAFESARCGNGEIWSSAAAHLITGSDKSGILDMDFWAESGGREAWRELHGVEEDPEKIQLLRRCTYCGRRFGEQAFVREVEESFRRVWRRWAFESTLADSPNSPSPTTAPSPSQKIATCRSGLTR